MEEDKYEELFLSEEEAGQEDLQEIPETPAPDVPEPKSKKVLKEVANWAIMLLISFAIAIFINEVILINARIVSGSMEKTIMTDDRVMGLRFSYWFSEPKRQDIVIFCSPNRSEKTMIKRIIGMPGDTVEIDGGKVYINGEVLEEPYLWEEMKGTFGPYEVPEGCYFMMGDNRNGSGDSRFWADPYVKREDILGKAVFTYWPRVKSLKISQ